MSHPIHPLRSILQVTLIILFIFIGYYAETYLHEQAHAETAAKYGVALIYEETITDFIRNGLAYQARSVSLPASEEDKEKLNALPCSERDRILAAGTKSDFQVLVFAFMLLLGLVAYARGVFEHISAHEKFVLTFAMRAIGIFMLVTIISLVMNMSPGLAGSDWNLMC